MSKRQEMREKRQREQQTQRMIIIVGGLVLVVAIALLFILPNLPKAVGDVTVPAAVSRPQVNFNAMGDPNAPVKIIEYSDYQCPYCARFSEDTEPLIISNYVATGKVYFEYRSFGNFIGEESVRAAEAAYCAGDQGKHWEMHDIIFANQKGENQGDFNDNVLTAFAEKIGLDMNQFKDCFNNNKYKDRVDQDGKEAFAAGVKATPSFVINGKLVEGAQPFSVFQQEIDAALAGQ